MYVFRSQTPEQNNSNSSSSEVSPTVKVPSYKDFL